MWSLGIMLLIVILAVSLVIYILLIRKKQLETAKKIEELNVKRDTARIVEEFKRERVEQGWEEFDRLQWEKRFEEEIK